MTPTDRSRPSSSSYWYQHWTKSWAAHYLVRTYFVGSILWLYLHLQNHDRDENGSLHLRWYFSLRFFKFNVIRSYWPSGVINYSILVDLVVEKNLNSCVSTWPFYINRPFPKIISRFKGGFWYKCTLPMIKLKIFFGEVHPNHQINLQSKTCWLLRTFKMLKRLKIGY